MSRRKSKLEKRIDEVACKMIHELWETGADAVVVMATFTQGNRSGMFYKKNGNDLLCDAMLRHAFHIETIQYVDDAEEEEEEQGGAE